MKVKRDKKGHSDIVVQMPIRVRFFHFRKSDRCSIQRMFEFQVRMIQTRVLRRKKKMM